MEKPGDNKANEEIAYSIFNSYMKGASLKERIDLRRPPYDLRTSKIEGEKQHKHT